MLAVAALDDGYAIGAGATLDVSDTAGVLANDVDTGSEAVVYFAEDFESLASQLGPLVSSSESGGDGTDWTATAPSGWTVETGSTPTAGPIEFFGWTFFDLNSWIITAGDQQRSEFTNASGVVAVADPDEYDDLGDIDPNLFTTTLVTPTINISTSAANTLQLSFASSWRPEDVQEAVVTVSFDGGPEIELLRFTSDANDANYKADAVNESIVLDLANPAGAETMTLRFEMPQAGNDWWWAIDNIVVEAPATETDTTQAFTGINDNSTWDFYTDDGLTRTNLFFEDWESTAASLGPFVSESESGGDGTDWTATPPTGWTVSTGSTPTGGPVEFFGWTFIDLEAWITTAGDQQRSSFTNASGVVAVADPDEYDDLGDIDPDQFNTELVSPVIDISGVAAGMLELSFNSSWLPEDTQEAEVWVSYDAGTPTRVLRYASDSADADYKSDAVNEIVQLALANPAGASTVQVMFSMPQAGNDWWWAIDNISLDAVSSAATTEGLAAAVSAATEKHVVFVGIDGVQYDILQSLGSAASEINDLYLLESYTGGDLGTATQQATSSGPGWSTLLTGVWVDEHGIPSNNNLPINASVDSLFERIDAAIDDAVIASIVNWSPINTGHFALEAGYLTDPAIIDYEANGIDDATVTSTVIDLINTVSPDFTFLHLDSPDGAGHSYGFGTEYSQAIMTASDQVGLIVAAVAAREAAYPDEDWLVIVSTDHGRQANTGYSHGGQSDSERQTFIASTEPLADFNTAVPATSVAATILDFLDIYVAPGELASGSVLEGTSYQLPPSIVQIVTPADDSTGVAVDADLVVQFSREVQAGSGFITVRSYDDGSVVQSIDVTSAAVTIVGDTVTIDLPVDLPAGEHLYVTIDEGAITSLPQEVDPEATGPSGLMASLVEAPAHGDVVLGSDGSFTYTPDEGFVGTDSFTYVASKGNTTSAAATVTLTVVAAPTLPGDYNLDNRVDLADYPMWRNTLGAEVTPYSGADGNGDGLVDADDYLVWKQNFGNVAVASGSTTSPVTAQASTAASETSAEGDSPARAAAFASFGRRATNSLPATRRAASVASNDSSGDAASADDELARQLLAFRTAATQPGVRSSAATTLDESAGDAEATGRWVRRWVPLRSELVR